MSTVGDLRGAWASLSRVQSDEDTYDMKSELICQVEELQRERDGCRYALLRLQEEVERLRADTALFRADIDDLTAVNNELRAERDALRADAERLRAALEVYADPSFYHACSFMFDRPTGGFDEDFDYDDEYERDMPGKHARETLAAIDAAMAQKD